MSDVVIIIVTWNCKDYLDQCLRSLACSGMKFSSRIILVDNNSSDGTVPHVREHYPDVQIIANAENMGFAGANNQAMKHARGRYVLLLNPDTAVHPGALDGLVEFLDSHENVWAAGPAMLNADSTPQRTGVRFPNNWDIAVESFFLDRVFPHSRLFGRHKELYEDPTKPRPVDYLQGSCLMVRFSAIENVGGLDEQFFLYFEEVDWCFIIKQAGGQVYYCPSGNVTHFGGGEFGHYDEQRLIYYHKSLMLFYQKHYSSSQTLVLRALLAVRAMVRILVWYTVSLVRPSVRACAISSSHGYVKILGLLLKRF